MGLSDANSAFNRNRTDAFSYSLEWSHFRHNLTGGFDFRRQQFNYLSQANPQGMLTFTGTEAGGSDFANFLLGLPDASAIAFGNTSNGGNPDKYLRQSVYDAYLRDDWRRQSSVDHQLRRSLGVWCADYRDEGTAGESGRREWVHCGRTCAGKYTRGTVDGATLSKLIGTIGSAGV